VSAMGDAMEHSRASTGDITVKETSSTGRKRPTPERASRRKLIPVTLANQAPVLDVRSKSSSRVPSNR
jgi:hypothetical protein